MHDSTVAVPPSLTMRTMKFESNADFQKRDPTRDSDAAFMKYYKKSWIQPKGDPRVMREVISTLLASSQGGDCVDDCIEKLLAEEIAYSDLASLTQTDLELIGFKHSKQQEELLGFLQLLPNQDPSYKNILTLPEAKTYNRKIFNNATSHLETMRSALSVANYKLKIMPVDDVIVGEKSFASRFVLEALSELKSVTDELDAQLVELDELVNNKKLKCLQKHKEKQIGSTMVLWILMSSVATGTLAAIWFLKQSK